MGKRKGNSGSGSWKKERASVSKSDNPRPRSNKYRPKADNTITPQPETRSRYWRGGYHRKDGTYVKGHYVKNPNYQGN